MSEPLIALLTDFGTADVYVGVMKAVILSIAPKARIVDLTHEVRAHDVLDGAFQLSASWAARGVEPSRFGDLHTGEERRRGPGRRKGKLAAALSGGLKQVKRPC
ncbi:MAG: SAM-dependent chlorinase/fluorinase [Acidobacteriota bacterium]